MYNEQQKQRYIDKQSNYSVKSRTTLVFNSIANEEIRQGKDISQINISSYADIIMDNMECDSYQYLLERVGILLRYRLFCYNTGFLDMEQWAQSGGSLTEYQYELNLREKYNERKKYDEYAKVLYSPELLSNYLLRNIPFVNIADKYSNITLHELTILFLMMHYFGIDKDEICGLKVSQISRYESNGEVFFVIRTNNRTIKATKNVARLLIKRFESEDVVTIVGNNQNTPIKLDKDYIFLYHNDDRDFKKKYQTFYNKYSHIVRKSDEKLPQIRQIIRSGILYRMCQETYSMKLQHETVSDIVRHYTSLTDQTIANEDAKMDLSIEFHLMYENYKESLLKEL